MEDIPINPLMIKMKDITLEFLTNPLYHSIINSKLEATNSNKINKQDLKFYRKRIHALSKDLLKGDSPNDSLKKIHDDYVRAAILYLKMIDTKDIIQDQYKSEILPDINNINFSNEMGPNEMGPNEMGPNEMGPNETTNVAEANQQMMRKIVNISNLDNYVISKNTQENELILPTKKEINLHTPDLKTKGIIIKDKKKSNKLK
jgi:hypothetical protein